MEYKAIESVLQTINPHNGEVTLTYSVSACFCAYQCCSDFLLISVSCLTVLHFLNNNVIIHEKENAPRQLLVEDLWLILYEIYMLAK